MSAKAGIIPLKQSAMGTVTSVAGNSANGFTVNVTTPTTTPTITVGTSLTGLMVGDGTAATALPFSGIATQYLDGTGAFSVPTGGTGTVTHTVGPLTTNALVIGNGGADVNVLASLGTTTTVLHGNAAGPPTYGAVSLTADVSGILAGTNGGTGVNNGARTITTGGNLTTVGAFASTFTMTNTTTVTFPTSGTLLSTATAVTVAQGGTSLGTLTSGGVLIGNGTGTPSFVVPGTAGNILTSVAGVWASQAPAASVSGLTLITSTTVGTAAASVAFTGIDSTYDEYEIHLITVCPTSAASLLFRTSSNNGSSYASVSGDYNWYGQRGAISGGLAQSGTPTTSIGLSAGGTVNAAAGFSGVIKLFAPSGATTLVQMSWAGVFNDGTDANMITGAGNRQTSAVVNAVQVLFNGTNVAVGSILKLYGVKK